VSWPFSPIDVHSVLRCRHNQVGHPSLFQTTSSSPLVWSIIPANCVLVCTTCKEGVQPSAIPAHLNKKHEIVIPISSDPAILPAGIPHRPIPHVIQCPHCRYIAIQSSSMAVHMSIVHRGCVSSPENCLLPAFLTRLYMGLFWRHSIHRHNSGQQSLARGSDTHPISQPSTHQAG